MSKAGTPTRYPGVTRISDTTFRVRGRVKNPKTGKSIDLDKIIDAVGGPEGLIYVLISLKAALGGVQIAMGAVSAASNVYPQGGSTPGTAILAATSGKWADLQSTGGNWYITASN